MSGIQSVCRNDATPMQRKFCSASPPLLNFTVSYLNPELDQNYSFKYGTVNFNNR